MAHATAAPPLARLPHNVEAERALLGAMLLDNRQIDVALGLIPGDAVQQAMEQARGRTRGPAAEPLFFSPAHQLIFAAICHLYCNLHCGVDLTTLGEELQRLHQLEAVGGAAYLAGLEDDLFSLSQVPEYVRIIVQKWQLRCLIRAAQAIAEEAARTDLDAREVLERSEQRVFEIVQERQSRDFVPIGELAVEQFEEIEARQKGSGALPGLETGFVHLDRLTGGLRPANMIVVAARPSVGKTAFSLNIAANVAVRHRKPVGIFSLEMSHAELATRLMCTLAHVSMGRVLGNARLRREELAQLDEARALLQQAPLHIDDTSSLTILEMRSRARRLKARCPDLALLVIDYLQLMHSGAARVENRQQEVTEISRAIKGLARELAIPVIAVSQLSRQSEQRRGSRDKLPRLSDLRESGAIEQDADMVIFIHRDLYTGDVSQAEHSQPQLAKVRIAKQRNGRTGDFDMLFLGEFTEFVDMAAER